LVCKESCKKSNSRKSKLQKIMYYLTNFILLTFLTVCFCQTSFPYPAKATVDQVIPALTSYVLTFTVPSQIIESMLTWDLKTGLLTNVLVFYTINGVISNNQGCTLGACKNGNPVSVTTTQSVTFTLKMWKWCQWL